MAEWKETISEIASSPGVVMVVGGVDTGKTNFCMRLCNAGYASGIPTAVVDADVGQSEIGAPGTIGMALADREIESLSDLRAKRLYFVGSTSPVGHMLESAVGSKKMVDAAIALGARLVIVDTTGLVDGPLGRKLKTYKADLIRPDYLVGIEKLKEIDHLLVPFTKVSSTKVRRLVSSDEVRTKPPEFRAARRRLNFYKHFHDAPGHIIRLDDVCCWNTWLGTGRPVKWQYMKSAEDLMKCRILHAEVTGRGIFMISDGQCRPGGRRDIEELFKTSNITIARGEAFHNLLVGLADENANTINVGLIQAIDFKQRFMFVLSPLKTISPVRVVQFGAVRVTGEGKEIETLKQGEI
ncbi:MAG: Clp1/GlmU family protein [Armatimonadota bacterium]